MNTESNQSSAATTQTSISESSRGWAAAAHFTSYLAFIIPFMNVIAPFAIAMMRKNEDRNSYHHAVQNFNFQLSWLLIVIGSSIVLLSANLGSLYFLTTAEASSTTLALASTGMLLVIAPVMLALVGIMLVTPAVNGVRAYRGQNAKYFYVINFMKSE